MPRSHRGRRLHRRHAAHGRIPWRGILIAAAILLAIDLAWASWAAFSGLGAARTSIDAGSDALQRGDLTLAASALADAEDSASGATSFGAHPTIMAAGALPFIGDDVHAISTMARATQVAARGGTALSAGLAATGWDGEGLPGFEGGGNLDLAVIEAASPSLQAAASGLDDAVSTARTIDVAGLVEPLGTAVGEARGRLEEQAAVVGAAHELSGVLPSMLGGDTPRTYLLAFQNLSAPRGTGGFFGYYGALRADDGAIELDALLPASTVPDVEPVPVPPDVARRYGPFGVRTTLYASNYSPDVPTSSRVGLAITERAGLGSFDGVVWADTVWMSDVLRAVGPVDSTAWPEPVTADNLVDVLNRQTFLIDSPVESDRVQGQIGLDVWRALLERPVEPGTFASAMSSSVASGHFAVYATSPEEQGAMERLGADGAFELGAQPLAVIWQDVASSRAGFFADKPVSSSVTLGADGSAAVETTVELRNEAPDGPPSILLGEGAGVTVGRWGADVEVYLPEGAQEIRVRTSDPSVIEVGRAFDRPVSDCFVYADSGSTMSCTVTYSSPGAASQDDGVWEYRMQVLPQAALRPSTTSVTISLPEGAVALEATPGATLEGGTLRWSGEPTVPFELWVRYELAD